MQYIVMPIIYEINSIKSPVDVIIFKDIFLLFCNFYEYSVIFSPL